MSPPPECDYPLVGVAELADHLGIRRQYVSRWVRYGKLPPPTYELAMGPVWLLDPDLQSTINQLRKASP